MKYFLAPLGCQMNKSDSERIASVLEEMGFLATESEEEADILGIVACSVRQKSINKVYSRIQKWNGWKKNKSLLTFLSGCILPADEVKFVEMFDLVFKINELPTLPQMITQYGVNTAFSREIMLAQEEKKDFDTLFWKIQPKYSSLFQAYIPIQNGCNKFCSFCAVPYTRGKEVSRPSHEILKEMERLVQEGYKTITLLGQNVNSYGLDRPSEEWNFAQLLEKIGQIGEKSGKEFWVYYTSPHPSDMKTDVLEMMAKYPCLARHVHLPIQSGDDDILKKMNRTYDMAIYRNIVQNIRKILPEATLFTDIIVGFSSETQEQFNNTLKAVEEFEYDMAYIAQYSPRPGAASYQWPDDVPFEEKKNRFHKLTECLKKITFQNNQKMIGKSYRCLVEGKDRKEGLLCARTQGLIPIHFPSLDLSLIGNFVDILIESTTAFAAAGKKLG
ncbi:MAG: tRNA (N6-isopentenyl adenosine(37)-C2)-methylthiotransferase MiaB [Candidatus Brocadiae bacterium]|nr:tRNA (N6-isopentenyl adenosine(37)-C2)-methylthiotransferase MiaB [Candidatus Brocadiia bacterium]